METNRALFSRPLLEPVGCWRTAFRGQRSDDAQQTHTSPRAPENMSCCRLSRLSLSPLLYLPGEQDLAIDERGRVT